VSRPPVYWPRDAEHTVLHQVIALHLEAFLDAVAEAGDGVGLPQFVEREFREFLLCGVFEAGVARFQCEGCAREHLVPFSCKGRLVSELRGPADDGAGGASRWMRCCRGCRCANGSSRCRIGCATRWHGHAGQRRPPQRPEIYRDVSVRLAGAMLPPGTCRAAARYYAVPGRLVGLSALKTNAAAAPPSSSATM
jgi:hypothetical protein